jgi:hypothetical protein
MVTFLRCVKASVQYTVQYSSDNVATLSEYVFLISMLKLYIVLQWRPLTQIFSLHIRTIFLIVLKLYIILHWRPLTQLFSLYIRTIFLIVLKLYIILVAALFQIFFFVH